VKLYDKAAVVTQPLSSSRGCFLPWLHKLRPTETTLSTEELTTADVETEVVGPMQRCLAEGLAEGLLPEAFDYYLKKSIRQAKLRTLAVDNKDSVDATEGLRFTVEETAACAHLFFHTDVMSFGDVEKLFKSMVLLRQAIARRFTDVDTAAYIKRWNFLFENPGTIITSLRRVYDGKVPGSTGFYSGLLAIPRSEIPSCLEESFLTLRGETATSF
jgi:hypothetical protein